MATSTTAAGIDIIGELAGVRAGSALADVRAQRPAAVSHAQGSYAALFDPSETGGLSHLERFAAALRVASLHQSTGAATHFRTRLQRAGAGQAVIAGAEAPPDQRTTRGSAPDPRLRAILRPPALRALPPVRATPDDLQLLVDAGLSTREIVSLSQVIAFVSFLCR